VGDVTAKPTPADLVEVAEFLAHRRLTARENVNTRGRRLLIEGRVIVKRVDREEVIVGIRGDSGRIWRVSGDVTGWHCRCPASGTCAHIVASALVTTLP
jgi:uncharacterized Zn finger protein